MLITEQSINPDNYLDERKEIQQSFLCVPLLLRVPACPAGRFACLFRNPQSLIPQIHHLLHMRELSGAQHQVIYSGRF